MTDLCPDGLRQRIRHRPVVEGTEQPALAVHREVARGPDRRGADITGEHGVVRGELIEHAGHVLRVAALRGPARRGQLVQARPRRSVVLERRHEVLVVPPLVEEREQGPKGRPRIPHEPVVDLRAPPELLAADVDLHDRRLLRKELAVREVRAEHQQEVAVHHRVIAGREPEQARHADVERVVVLDELLAPHRVHDRRLQPAREGGQLRVRARTPRAAEDRRLRRRVQNPRQRRNLIFSGHTEGLGSGKCRRGSCSTASRNATSPGRTMTETPRRDSAV